jgi:hypothetical protein
MGSLTAKLETSLKHKQDSLVLLLSLELNGSDLGRFLSGRS